jgi:hypothetical protein
VIRGMAPGPAQVEAKIDQRLNTLGQWPQERMMKCRRIHFLFKAIEYLNYTEAFLE